MFLAGKKIGIVCASGIGDALIIHMVSHHLQQLGAVVTTFSNHLSSFGPWLQGYTFSPQPSLEKIESTFQPFDALFLQHDNTSKSKKIHELPLPIYTFYGSHIESKHGPFNKQQDFACDPNRTMVENTLEAMQRFFGSSSLDNGLKAPEGLIHRKFKTRIAIHPTSTSEAKNWPREKFLQLAEHLKGLGYEPVFTVAPHERELWPGPLFASLGDLASFLYESGCFIGNDSGTGHLASYLRLPNLTIGGNPTQLKLWRPGWGTGEIATLTPWQARWKIAKNNWKHIITVKKIIKSFNEMAL